MEREQARVLSTASSTMGHISCQRGGDSAPIGICTDDGMLVGLAPVPVCPLCHAEMVPFRHELDDGSGWMFGWLCDCTAETRERLDTMAKRKKKGKGC
jgi:hypothetical protein